VWFFGPKAGSLTKMKVESRGLMSGKKIKGIDMDRHPLSTGE